MESKRRRKTLRLKGYDYSTPGSYFVTICTDDRSPRFSDAGLKAIVEATWASIPSRFPSASLDVFVIMPNHVHFVLHLGDEWPGPGRAPTLGDVVGAFKSVVAVEWLRHVKRERPQESVAIWQRGYYEHIIRSESELARIRDYIANNPSMWQFDPQNPDRVRDAEYEKAWSWIEQS